MPTPDEHPAADPPTLSTWSALGALSAPPAPAPGGRDVVQMARLMVLFVCLALIATNGWLIKSARELEIDQATLANTNLARAVAEQVGGSVSAVEHIVDGIVYELERSDITPETLQRLQPVLVLHVAGAAQLKGLFVYDAEGWWIASSEPVWDPSLNNSDRAYFVHHRGSESARTLIGTPIVSRSSGEWVVPLSRRVNNPDGSFAGVVLATLSIQHMRDLLDRFDVGTGGAIALSVSARMMVRKPFNPADIGKPVATPFAELFSRERSGHLDALSPIDGVQRLISFEHTRNYPVLVTVATSKDEVLRSWRAASIVQTAWVSFLCLLLVLAGIFTNRSFRQRLRAEGSLRQASDALADANRQLAHLAQNDGLTGLANRRYFDARLVRAFRRAQRDRQALAIVMVDVDEFKKYNDLYGHVEGDHCLRKVARAVGQTAARPDDLVARYGGEELVLLLPGTDAEGAAQVAQAARLAVFDLQLPHAASAVARVTVSLGVAAQRPEVGDTPDALLKAADLALYEAKRGGRNRVCSAPVSAR